MQMVGALGAESSRCCPRRLLSGCCLSQCSLELQGPRELGMHGFAQVTGQIIGRIESKHDLVCRTCTVGASVI